MNKTTIAAIVLAAVTLAGCGNPTPRSDLAYLDHRSGTYVMDHSPYNGQFWDRYHYGPRY
jgi:hypothetical protein